MSVYPQVAVFFISKLLNEMCVLKLKVNWLEHILGSEWKITPAGGSTGDAYFAKFQDRELFLKRNSSPFLAMLSAEGIVPKLVWTRRMENGDVITAQHWLNGRELKPSDMVSTKVAKLLSKIHYSQELLDMLKRLGKTPLRPDELLQSLYQHIDHELLAIPAVQEGIRYLQRELPNIHTIRYGVCHCDVHHNNWLLGENGQMYLIDWDEAMIADPAIDLGLLFYLYIPKSEWGEWLEEYGAEMTDDLEHRMKWYAISQMISLMQSHKDCQDEREMNRLHHHLSELVS
ncbi:Thiamine kinase [Priestia filamentosa]|uniref:Thiamine kinase n=1 Tax=Priestia endophytica DSM 13796 TaxID=1121089 RepID=A0A1I5X060_9BACI|nr:Thiamine kinase [Priestia endophytica DSM 13796]SMF00782.1 Thiamine kinase [Priestia filamentosa]